jgi:hypothetical protein
MDYHLPRHSSFAAVGARVVFLDLDADRYFLLRGAEAEAVLSAGSRAPQPIQRLITRGLLCAGPGKAVRPVAAIAPTSSALEAAHVDGRLPLRELLYHRAEAAILLRLLGLQATLARMRRIRRKSLTRPQRVCARAEAARLARGFARARLFLPATRLCVPDSIALARSVWRRGIAADLYFGVRLDPFAAHCWLQHEDLLLSDPLNFVADYTPVFRL